MLWFERIVEARIREAQERGEFDALPGYGKPLRLDDDTLVPEDLKLAYRVLRNAGYLPPEIERRRELGGLGELLAGREPEAAGRGRRRARLLLMRLAAESGTESALWLQEDYYRKLCAQCQRKGSASAED